MQSHLGKCRGSCSEHAHRDLDHREESQGLGRGLLPRGFEAFRDLGFCGPEMPLRVKGSGIPLLLNVLSRDYNRGYHSTYGGLFVSGGTSQGSGAEGFQASL